MKLPLWSNRDGNEMFGGGRSDMYAFSYKTSQSSISQLLDTISWKCSLKDDCIRSSLIECQSFPNRKIAVDPLYRVLMFLPSAMQLLCTTWYTQVNLFRILDGLCLWDQKTERIPFVSCLNSDLQVSIHC